MEFLRSAKIQKVRGKKKHESFKLHYEKNPDLTIRDR